MTRNAPKKRPSTFVRLMKLLFQFNPRLLPAIIALILVSAVISSLPSIFQQKVVAVIEQAWAGGWDWDATRPLVARYVGILAALYACGLIITTVNNQLQALHTQRALDQFRVKMFEHMEGLPIRYFDTHQRGDIMSHYTNDVDAMRQMISQSFPQLLVSLVTVVTILCIMLYYSIWMGLVIIAGAAVTVTLTRKIGGKSARYFMAQQKYIGKTEGVIEEMIHGQKVIKVFNHEAEAQAEFDAANDALYEAAFQANRYSNTLMPVINNVNYLVYVLVAVAGGLFLELGVPNLSVSGLPFSIAVIVPFLGMCRQFSGSIQQISPQINAVVMGIAGAKRIFALLDEASEADEGYVELVNARESDGQLIESSSKTGLWAWKHTHQATGETDYVPLRGDVRFFDVDFAYNPDKVILHNITLYGKPGQKIAFVGATGAGKTTITNLINRFYDIADGKIRYDGININAPLAGHGAAGNGAVHRHGDGQHPLRPAGRHRRGVHRRGEAGGRGRLHHPPAPGLPDDAGRRRQQPVPGPVPAAGHRPRRRGRPAGDDPGRGHELHRHPHGADRAGGHGPADAGPHGVRDRPPAVDRQERRRDPGAGPRPRDRARYPRRPDRRQGPVLPALHRRVRAGMTDPPGETALARSAFNGARPHDLRGRAPCICILL